MPKLTKGVVDGCLPRERPYVVWCSELKGFGVSISSKGTKTYVVDYRTTDRTRRRMTLGRHGVLAAEEARRMALKTLADALRGSDPQMERKARWRGLTVSDLCDRYLLAAAEGRFRGRTGAPKKQSTLRSDRSRIEHHIKPLLGRMLVTDLKRSDIIRFVRDVEIGKTARQFTRQGRRQSYAISIRGGAGTATRTTGCLGAILHYAMDEGLIEANPVRGVPTPAYRVRDRRLDQAEFRALNFALEAAQIYGASPKSIAILKLLALTGCRLNEIVALQWSEVDFSTRMLRLSDTKTGPSVRPLGGLALQLLKGIQRDGANPYVFPAVRSKNAPYGGFQRFHRRLFKAAGLPGVTPHILRHSFASVGAEIGFTDSTIGACLGHAGNSMTSRYIHRLDSVLIAAADRIASEVHRQMNGQAVLTDNAVVGPN